MTEEVNTKCLHIISREKAKELGMKRYFLGEPCGNGHASERYVYSGKCVVCRKDTSVKNLKNNPRKLVNELSEEEREKKRAKQREQYHKNKDVRKKVYNRYVKQHPDKVKEYQKKATKNRKGTLKFKEYHKNYYDNNSEAVKKRANDWYYNNKDRAMARQSIYDKNRREEDPTYKMRGAARNMVVRMMRITGEEKTKRTHELLGYSPKELTKHLESRFVDGMSWDNWEDIHIDHLYPVSKFIEEGVTDYSIINHLDNLVPMWWWDNLDKKNMTLEEWLEKKGKCSREWELYSRYL